MLLGFLNFLHVCVDEPMLTVTVVTSLVLSSLALTHGLEECSSGLPDDATHKACYGWCNALEASSHCEYCKVLRAQPLCASLILLTHTLVHLVMAVPRMRVVRALVGHERGGRRRRS